MKTFALWLYGVTLLLSVFLGGPENFTFWAPGLLLFATMFLGIVYAFLLLFRGVGSVKTQVKEHREHGRWIL
jgi:hypothetical protein